MSISRTVRWRRERLATSQEADILQMLTFASPRHVIHSTTNTLESMSEELGKKTFSLSIDDQVICASSFLRRFNHCMLWDDDAVATSFSHSYHDAVQLKLATHREPVAVFSIGISTLDGNDMVVLHSLSDGSIICIPRNQESGSSSHLLSSLGSRPIPEPRKDDDSSDIERLTTSTLGVSLIARQEISMRQTASEDRDWLGQTADIPPQESDDTSCLSSGV